MGAASRRAFDFLAFLAASTFFLWPAVALADVSEREVERARERDRGRRFGVFDGRSAPILTILRRAVEKKTNFLRYALKFAVVFFCMLYCG